MAKLCTRIEVRNTTTHFDHHLRPRSRGVKLSVGRYRITCNRTGVALQRKDRRWWISWDAAVEALKSAGTPV